LFTRKNFAKYNQNSIKYLFENVHSIKKSNNPYKIGPKYSFEMLPQVQGNDEEEFDDMLDIDLDPLSSRKKKIVQEEKPEIFKQQDSSKATKHKPEHMMKVASVRAPYNTPVISQSKPQPIVHTGNKPVTMAELSKHCKVNDAWTAIRGEVFDITQYFNLHPGGHNAISKIMGKDGTALFGTVR